MTTHYNIHIKAENKDRVLLGDISGAIPRVSETLAIYDRQTNTPTKYTVTEVKYTYVPNCCSVLYCVADVYCVLKEGE